MSAYSQKRTVRPDGADRQWREVLLRELSVDLQHRIGPCGDLQGGVHAVLTDENVRGIVCIQVGQRNVSITGTGTPQARIRCC